MKGEDEAFAKKLREEKRSAYPAAGGPLPTDLEGEADLEIGLY